MWNCGKPIGVSRWRIRETDISRFGDGPRYSPILSLRFHFDILPTAWCLFCRAYTGNPKAWVSLCLVAISDMVNRLVGLVPHSLSGKKLRIWLAWCSAYEHRDIFMALGHLDLAWWIYLRVFSCNYLVLFYEFIFCKWAFNPQKYIFCL